jgi:putative PIN family toxin of toxin-antitoxin system
MIRAVLDTNIIVSALLQPLGPPAQILMLALGGSIQLCVSGSVYAEYEEVIRRPRFQRSEDIIAGTLQAIREKGIWVRPTERVTACPDPDDDIFLECAVAAKADYIVTGNLKHFPVSWAGSRIVTPRWLLDNITAEKSEGTPEAVLKHGQTESLRQGVGQGGSADECCLSAVKNPGTKTQ